MHACSMTVIKRHTRVSQIYNSGRWLMNLFSGNLLRPSPIMHCHWLYSFVRYEEVFFCDITISCETYNLKQLGMSPPKNWRPNSEASQVSVSSHFVSSSSSSSYIGEKIWNMAHWLGTGPWFFSPSFMFASWVLLIHVPDFQKWSNWIPWLSSGPSWEPVKT